MSITIELPPEIEQMARAKAEAKGISVEEYLSDLVKIVAAGSMGKRRSMKKPLEIIFRNLAA